MKAYFFLLFFLTPCFLSAQVKDSMVIKDSFTGSRMGRDSAAGDTAAVKRDSSATVSSIQQPSPYQLIVEKALRSSKYLNSAAKPVAIAAKEKKQSQNDFLFYFLLMVVLFLAFLRLFFERYFNNLFRVFFNTSLRQSQLTDQLLQAKQVSLFFNILFAVSAGLYVYSLLDHFNWLKESQSLSTISVCILSVASLYFIKYLSLKFTGWLTGYRAAANTYLFVIFLINKILGILLLPFVIVILFAGGFLQYPAVLVSSLMIGFMFLMRFLRSYALLRKEIKVSRFHFFIYIAGVELMPLLLICKGLMVLFGKKL